MVGNRLSESSSTAASAGRQLKLINLNQKIDNGVKVFELTSSVIQWEYDAGKKAEAWAYNGQVPGPEIRVTEGDKLPVIVKNQLPESTDVDYTMILNDQLGGFTFNGKGFPATKSQHPSRRARLVSASA